MPKAWPERIDPTRWAEQGKEIVGHCPLADLERLVTSLSAAEGGVDFRLCFGTDTEGRHLVTGRITTHLSLLCQRCLSPFGFPVDREVSLCVVEDLDSVDRLPAAYDPLMVEDGFVSVREVVEDELLLSLPVVATHALEQCPARAVLAQYAAEEPQEGVGKPNPFSILRSVS